MQQKITFVNQSPQEALNRLRSAIATLYDYSLMVGGKNDQPRIAIQRRIRYQVIRGLNTYTHFTLVGRFNKSRTGDTVLTYEIKGEPIMVGLYASIWITIIPTLLLLIFTLPTPPPAVVSIGLTTFLLGATMFYLWLVRYWYKSQIRVMRQLVERFAR